MAAMPKKDRTLSELDAALARTAATTQKIDVVLAHAEARERAAKRRQESLKLILSAVCDDCASFPCLLPSSATAARPGNACASCSAEIVGLDKWATPSPAREQPTVETLRRELLSDDLQESHGFMARRFALPPSPATGWAKEAPGARAGAPAAGEQRKRMWEEAKLMVARAAEELQSVRQLKQSADQKMQALQGEQKALLSRLAGCKRSRDDACHLCAAGARTHLLVPCGHKCMCASCALKYKGFGHTCPMCRARVERVLEVYD
ncbi:hypothetical protein AB1Y20_011700 [Prymnesium parvum]|uniref:RING-type domain-containing protein n=1 Tax=Prymnesium parvum TaxID=97485 RepID=A0AB34IJR9_PRYPA